MRGCATVAQSTQMWYSFAESEELLSGELRAVVRDDGVRDFKSMDDVHEEQHGLLGFDHGDRPSLYPLCELVHSDK